MLIYQWSQILLTLCLCFLLMSFSNWFLTKKTFTLNNILLVILMRDVILVHSYGYQPLQRTLKKFLSLYLLAGIIQKPSLSQYWSTDALLQTSVFNHIMSRNRFQMILQFIHFADSSLYDRKDPNRNRLYKAQFSSSCSTNLNSFMYLLSLYLLMKSSCFGKVG